MSLYSNEKGFYEREYRRLRRLLVLESGEANTIQGELLRNIGHLGYEYYTNGNFNWSRFEQQELNFLHMYLSDPNTFVPTVIEQIIDDLERMNYFGKVMSCFSGGSYNFYEEGEDAYDRITDRVIEWCYANRLITIQVPQWARDRNQVIEWCYGNPQLTPLKSGAEAPEMTSISDIFKETPQRYQRPSKRTVASVDWRSEPTRVFKLKALGKYEADYRLSYSGYVYSNARTRNDFYDAYAVGVEITGIDIQSRCKEGHGELTNEEYQMLKQSAITHDDSSSVWADEEPPAYVDHVWQYLDIWATIAHIGNPNLTMEVTYSSPYPWLHIGGNGLFQPRGGFGHSHKEQPVYNSDYSIMFRNWRDPSPTLPHCSQYEFTTGQNEQWSPAVNFYVLSNAPSAIEIQSAHNEGAKIVDIDLISPGDGFEQNISVRDLKKIIEKAQPEDLNLNNAALPYFYDEWGLDEFDIDENEDIVMTLSREGYFVLWRAIARIGNPNLILHLSKDNTETVHVGGHGSFNPY